MHKYESASQALLTKPVSEPKPFRGPPGRPARFPGEPNRPDVSASTRTTSRQIVDLAREFNCLGYFQDDDDLPRAA
jgi:hypothetical protein